MSHRLKKDRGATLVEGAIVLPLWILLFIAMADIYFMISAYINLTSFAREALYIGGVMNDKYIPPTDNRCYMSGTSPTSDALSFPSPGTINPNCIRKDTLYANQQETNNHAVNCFIAPGEVYPRDGQGCGHWLLNDKMFLLAKSDHLLDRSSLGYPKAGSFSALHMISRRTSIDVSVTSTPKAGSSTYASTNIPVATLQIGVRGSYKGIFALFNGISIGTLISGPHSSQLLPSSDRVVF